MPATLDAGTIYGYCVGEPWNQQAVQKGIGVAVITDDEIWKDNPEKVFGVSKEWADANPNTHVAVVKALIRAAMWLDADDNANREEAVQILSKPNYVGADVEVLRASMTGTFEYEPGDIRPAKDFNIFFRKNATYPFYSDAIWYLTQMRRWGQITETKPNGWYKEVASKVYQPEVYMTAAEALIAEGKAKRSDFPFGTDGYKPPQNEFIDNITYDGRNPNGYLAKFPIGLKKQEVVQDDGTVTKG